MNTQESAAHVDVHLTGCTRQDAEAVFGALEAAFPAEGPGLGEMREASRPGTANPSVWCMTLDARRHGAPAGPVTLSAPVVAHLFGEYQPVRQVREALSRVLASEMQGTISGEHEFEVRLRLMTGPPEGASGKA
ncbi:hypothetical protein [Streptomyces sp. URMC 123]|uniref:hypothetical protein n=1 Tax=Streptomyces sp. URMC 123 TaxID=3423403 RepID=UPI003F1CA59A